MTAEISARAGATVPAASLEALAARVAGDRGLPPEHVALFVRALVDADLRGIPTHGMFRLPAYARAIDAGDVNPRPDVTVVQARTATELLDGDNGLGLVLGQLAMRRAVALARLHGVGAVAVRNGNHAGMLAIHVRHAVDAGMIGYVTANAPAMMAPHGGRDPLLGNAPFAYGIPTGGEPVIADMACSLVARGKIRLAAQRGEEIPEGWAVDAEGRPTRDARAAMDGVLLPMAGHKGYSLAVVNEILAGSLPGAVLSMAMSRQFLLPGARAYDSWGAGQLAIAVDPDAFVGRGPFEASARELIQALKRSRPATGTEEVLVPGEPEARLRERQLRDGVALSAAVVAALEEFCDEAGLDWPPATEDHA